MPSIQLLSTTLVFAVLSVVASGQQPPPAKPAPEAAGTTIVVPHGKGVPVITDGVFSPGEWDDGLRVALSETVELYVKEYGGVVFIGARNAMIGPSDLFVCIPGGPIHQLHRSAQLQETVLPPTGAARRLPFGLTPDWYANEERRDMEEAERLQKAGKSPIEIIRATSYPSDGIEFAIRRSKFPGERWLMRLEASVLLAGDKPGMLTYPPGSTTRTTNGWMELRFEQTLSPARTSPQRRQKTDG
jgi:hypothetical protein